MSTWMYAVVAAAVLTQFAVIFHHRPVLALATVSLVGIATYWLPASFRLSIGSIELYPADCVALALLVATTFGVVTRRCSTPPARVWCVLLALLALAVARGVPVFGMNETGNAVRGYFQFFAVTVFFSTSAWKSDLMRALYWCWGIAAGVVLGVALASWLGNGFGGFAVEERVLTSGPALVLAQATVMAVASDRSAVLTRCLAPVGLFSLLLIQQRTVWVVVAVSLTVIAVLRFGSDAGVRRARLVIAGGVAALALLLVAGPAGLSRSLDRAVKEPMGEQSTFAWRLDGWQLLVARRADVPPFDLLAGDPAGTGFERRIGDAVTEVSAHNYYVAVLNSFGIIGLAALVLGYLEIIRRLTRLHRRARPEANDAAVLVVLVLGQLTYFLGYGTSIEQGVFTGLAGALAWSRLTQPTPQEDREPALSH